MRTTTSIIIVDLLPMVKDKMDLRLLRGSSWRGTTIRLLSFVPRLRLLLLRPRLPLRLRRWLRLASSNLDLSDWVSLESAALDESCSSPGNVQLSRSPWWRPLLLLRGPQRPLVDRACRKRPRGARGCDATKAVARERFSIQSNPIAAF